MSVGQMENSTETQGLFQGRTYETIDPRTTPYRANYFSGRGVYILHSRKTGLYKIGKTVNLRQRMRSFYQIIPEDIQLFAFCQINAITKLESNLHQVFSEKRDKGEWFRLSTHELAVMFNSFGFIPIHKSLKDFLSN